MYSRLLYLNTHDKQILPSFGTKVQYWHLHAVGVSGWGRKPYEIIRSYLWDLECPLTANSVPLLKYVPVYKAWPKGLWIQGSAFQCGMTQLKIRWVSYLINSSDDTK